MCAGGPPLTPYQMAMPITTSSARAISRQANTTRFQIQTNKRTMGDGVALMSKPRKTSAEYGTHRRLRRHPDHLRERIDASTVHSKHT
jgi:hypothetical protein